jgi:hypothetical protein
MRSSYLAMVELALPDLPWLFTPAGSDGNLLRPWICLVAIADGEGVELDVPPTGPAVLHLDKPVDLSAELPDLAHIDAWAHAQVSVDSTTGAALDGNPAADPHQSVDCRVAGPALNAALDANTAARLGRLVAPRKLEPNRSYIACIVPTYRAGVNAGLGLAVDEKDLAPAWDATTTAPFQLPVYYHFRFSNRPVGVKHFQAIHHCSVNVAHGLALLFGIGTKAVPSWDPRTRRNNPLVGLTVEERQVQAEVRTHLIHRPARDIFPPQGRTRVSSYRI